MIFALTGLKKVTADMQTHKNPELRGQGAPEPKAKSPAKPAAKPAAAVSSIHIPNVKLHRIAFQVLFQRNAF